MYYSITLKLSLFCQHISATVRHLHLILQYGPLLVLHGEGLILLTRLLNVKTRNILLIFWTWSDGVLINSWSIIWLLRLKVIYTIKWIINTRHSHKVDFTCFYVMIIKIVWRRWYRNHVCFVGEIIFADNVDPQIRHQVYKGFDIRCIRASAWGV